MTKLWQFSQSQPIPAFSKKVQRGDQRKFFKNRLKRSPHLKGPEALQHKWHYPLISMHLKCKDWRRFRRKQRLKKGLNGEVMAIFGRSPKTCFFKKSAKVDQKKFFKNRPKKQPPLQKANGTLAQMTLSSKMCPLITQRVKKVLAQKADPKVPEWLSYGNSRKVNQKPHFLKKCKGRTKGNFSKIA